MTANAQLWQDRALQYGPVHAATMATLWEAPELDPALSACYYDATAAFYLLRDLSGEVAYTEAARQSFHVYARRYVLQSGCSSFWYFPRGILRHLEETWATHGRWSEHADALDAEAALATLADNQFAAWWCHLNYLWETDFRSPAYAMDAHLALYQSKGYGYIYYEDKAPDNLEMKRVLRYNLIAEQALCQCANYLYLQIRVGFKPFMLGLMARSLIERHEWCLTNQYGEDRRTVPILQRWAEYLWRECWLPEFGGFQYSTVEGPDDGTGPAPDLNLLIAPLYGWLHKQTQTSHSVWKERGDQVFNFGIDASWLEGAKQFNQYLYWSRDYLAWTGQLPAPEVP
jgi:hypothetical protein